MDPKAALDAAEEALKSGDKAEARERLADYFEWRRRGGFQPSGGDARHAALLKRAGTKDWVKRNSRKARLRRNADGGPNLLLLGGLAVGGYLAYRWLTDKSGKAAARPAPVVAASAAKAPAAPALPVPPASAPSNVSSDRGWAAYQNPSNSLKFFEFPPEQPGLPSPRAAHDRFWNSLTETEKAEALRLYSMTPEQLRAMQSNPNQSPTAAALMLKLMAFLEQLTAASSAPSAPTPPAKTGTSGIGNYYNEA